MVLLMFEDIYFELFRLFFVFGDSRYSFWIVLNKIRGFGVRGSVNYSYW